ERVRARSSDRVDRLSAAKPVRELRANALSAGASSDRESPVTPAGPAAAAPERRCVHTRDTLDPRRPSPRATAWASSDAELKVGSANRSDVAGSRSTTY